MKLKNAVTKNLFALAALPALYLFLCWHSFDGREVYGLYADGINYVYTATKIKTAVNQSVDFVQAAQAIYETRVWKGIVLPQIFFPFLTLTGGDDSLAVFLFQFCFLFSFLFYLYRILCFFSDPIFSAAGTALISTIPWIMALSVDLDSFFTFSTLVLAGTYHLLRSDFFKKTNHSLLFGGLVGLASLLRPTELVLCFGGPFAIYLYLAVHRSTAFSRRDAVAMVYLFGITLTTGFSLWSLDIIYPNSLLALVLLVPLQMAPFIFIKKLRLNFNPLAAILLIVLQISIWWIPFTKSFLHWHAQAINEAPPSKLTMWALFEKNYGSLGSYGLYLLMAIALSQVFVNFRKYHGSQLASYLSYFYLLLIPIFVMGLFPVFEFRYSMGPFIYIWIFTLMLSRYKGNRLTNSLALFFVIALCVTQFRFDLGRISGETKYDGLSRLLRYDQLPGILGYSLGTTQVPPMKIQIDELQKLLPSDLPDGKKIEVSILDRSIIGRGITDYLLNFFATREKLPLQFRWVPESDLKNENCTAKVSCIEQLFPDSEYVMIRSSDNEKTESDLGRKLFLSNSECRLQLVGIINSIRLLETHFSSYQVFKKDCPLVAVE